MHLRGGRDEEMPLRWQLYNDGGKRVPGNVYRQTPIGFLPRNQDHQRTARLWLPLPPAAGRYFVRFTVLNPKGETIDEVNSEPFRFSESQRRTGGRPSATSPSWSSARLAPRGCMKLPARTSRYARARGLPLR